MKSAGKENLQVNKILHRAKQQRQHPTDAENLLWHQLRARRLNNLKFKRQVPIGDYIVDFVCQQKNLIIEVDGGQHLNQTNYDRSRTKYLEQCGFHIFRVWNHEVFYQIDSVLEQILRFCD